MNTQHSASVFQVEDISYVIVLSVLRWWLVFAHYWPILKSPGSKFVFIQNKEQISRGKKKKTLICWLSSKLELWNPCRTATVRMPNFNHTVFHVNALWRYLVDGWYKMKYSNSPSLCWVKPGFQQLTATCCMSQLSYTLAGSHRNITTLLQKWSSPRLRQSVSSDRQLSVPATLAAGGSVTLCQHLLAGREEATPPLYTCKRK